MSNRRKGLLKRISRYLEILEMPFVETNQTNNREYFKIRQGLRNQLSFESYKEDSAHFEISASNDKVEVDYKKEIWTLLFDSEHLLLKDNNGTKRIKISENEEYLQISKLVLVCIEYDNYDHNLEKYDYSDDYEDECINKPITYEIFKSSWDSNEEETKKNNWEEVEEEIEQNDQIFFECPYYQITKDTAKRFKEGEMFNDEIINAYISLLKLQNSDIYIFETSFINLLEKYQNRPSDMLYFLGNYLFKNKIESISKFKKMLLPAYLDKHWMLFVINFEEQNIEWYDSVCDQLSWSKYETIKLFIKYIYFREKVSCVSKIFCRKRVRWMKQRNTYDWGLYLCSNMYRVVSNKIVNLTRKTLKDQLFNVKIEECVHSEWDSYRNDKISNIKRNQNKENDKINEEAEEASYINNKMNKYENKLKVETIKIVWQGIYQHFNNLNIKSKQEMEEAEVKEKTFNSKVDN